MQATEAMQVSFFIKYLVEVYSKTEDELVKVQSSKNVNFLASVKTLCRFFAMNIKTVKGNRKYLLLFPRKLTS